MTKTAERTFEMKKEKKKSKRRTVAVVLSAAAVLLAAVGILYALALHSTHALLTRVVDMSSDELLEEALSHKKDACVTVGILKDGQMSYEVYGEDAQRLEQTEYRYEIGSVTKTMTAELTARAVLEGRLELTDTIDKYLNLPAGKVYPTIKALLTHTSGLDEEYYEWSMLPYVFRREVNPLRGITAETILKEYNEVNLEEGREYGFGYSNYGFALLGLVLEEVYDTDYTSLLNDYLENELDMTDTYVSNGDADFEGNWQWDDGDAYIPAGAVVSNITDMLLYARAQLGSGRVPNICHMPLVKVDASDKWDRIEGLCVDEVGMSWMIDTENGFIWHNGGTGVHSSYLGFCPEKDTAVVVLSNLSQDEDISATAIGFKKLLEISSDSSSSSES